MYAFVDRPPRSSARRRASRARARLDDADVDAGAERRRDRRRAAGGARERERGRRAPARAAQRRRSLSTMRRGATTTTTRDDDDDDDDDAGRGIARARRGTTRDDAGRARRARSRIASFARVLTDSDGSTRRATRRTSASSACCSGNSARDGWTSRARSRCRSRRTTGITGFGFSITVTWKTCIECRRRLARRRRLWGVQHRTETAGE